MKIRVLCSVWRDEEWDPFVKLYNKLLYELQAMHCISISTNTTVFEQKPSPREGREGRERETTHCSLCVY